MTRKDSPCDCFAPLSRNFGIGFRLGRVVLVALGLGLFFSTAVLPQSGLPPGSQQIEHSPAAFGIDGKPLSIEARVMAPGRAVVYLRLYFKSNRDQAFKFINMRPSAQGHIGQIPAGAVRVPAVQYFLVALLSDRSVINYPMRNPYGQPVEVLVRENTESRIETRPVPVPKATQQPAKPPENKAPQEVSPQLLDKIERLNRPVVAEETPAPSGETLLAPILVLSPEPFSAVSPQEVFIAASFMTETAIDSASIRILLDGRNVTRTAQVSPALVSFTPTKIAAGEHTVIISARDRSGAVVGPLNWRFQVTGQENEPGEAPAQNRVSGMAYAEMRREKFNGVSLNNTNVGADLSGNTGPVQYSASAYFTTLEDEILQPRNRFVLTAGLPWLNVTLGDATPYFDELILYGRRVRGIQASLNTGWFNFDVVTGETVRQIDPLYTLAPNPADSTQLITTRQRFGTFRQTLLGLRPSFGSRDGFHWGFTLLKVRDDKKSLPQDSSNVVQTGRVTPRDNLVIGSDIGFAFDHRRVEVKAGGAWSLLTNDISAGALSSDSLKNIADVDLPFNPQNFESWFILNESTSPLDPRGKTSLAYQLTFNFNYFNQSLTAGFKQIGSEYLSLGHSFLRNDRRGFFINDRWRAMRNRVYLTLGLESYDDHFNNIDGRPATKLTTWQFGVGIFWDPNLPSFNFNFRNNNRDNNLIGNPDTTLINIFAPEDNATRDLSFSLNYDFNAMNLEHSVMLNLSNSNRVDNLRSAIPGDVASNLKSISVRTRYRMPLTSTLTFATNDNNIAGGQNLYKYSMLSGRADYDFSRQRTTSAGLQIRAYGAFSRVSASGGTSPGAVPAGTPIAVINYNQTGFQFGGVLQYDQNHEFTLDINLLNYKDRGGLQTINAGAPTFTATNPSFNNSLIRAYYTYRL
jgi:hypothetical protein